MPMRASGCVATRSIASPKAVRASAVRPWRRRSAPTAYQVLAQHSRAYRWPRVSAPSSSSNSSSARLSSPRSRRIRPRSQCRATGWNLHLPALRRECGRQLPFGFGQNLTGHVHGRGQPVCQRKIRKQGERSLRRTQPLFTPAGAGEAEVVAPVVWLEGDGALGGRQRVHPRAARPVEHESQRGPRFAGLRIEAARLTCVHGRPRPGRRYRGRDRRASSRTASRRRSPGRYARMHAPERWPARPRRRIEPCEIWSPSRLSSAARPSMNARCGASSASRPASLSREALCSTSLPKR